MLSLSHCLMTILILCLPISSLYIDLDLEWVDKGILEAEPLSSRGWTIVSHIIYTGSDESGSQMSRDKDLYLFSELKPW